MAAFIYLYTCKNIRGFGADTALNGFILVLFLIVGEADTPYIIGTIVLTALAEILRGVFGYDQLMIPVIDNIPMLVIVLVLTIPVAIFAMRLAERTLK